MALRQAAPRPTPRERPRREPLNFSSAPRTEREWIVYRAGVREGIERAQADARAKAEQFMTRFDTSGVELSTPSAAAAVQTSASHPDWMQASAAAVKAFKPQLKRRRTA